MPPEPTIWHRPFRFTTTKKNLSPVLGLEGYTSILAQMNEADIRIPVVAIGGIVAEDIPAIMETGVNGIASPEQSCKHRTR